MFNPKHQPILSGALKAHICLLLITMLTPAAYAQSYSEDMSTMAAQEFYDDVQRRIRSGTTGGPSYYLSRDYTFTPEEEEELRQQQKRDKHLNELARDPEVMRLVNGYWDHYRSQKSAAPGEYCAASYASLDGVITLASVDKSWKGGLLVFMGKDVPKPDKFSEITATLTQSRGKPATVRIFNAQSTPETANFGTLIFAVPSMEAALEGMRDKEKFAVSVEGKWVFAMSWKDGIAARNALRKCLKEG